MLVEYFDHYLRRHTRPLSPDLFVLFGLYVGRFDLPELFVFTADAVQAAEELFDASLHHFFILF